MEDLWLNDRLVTYVESNKFETVRNYVIILTYSKHDTLSRSIVIDHHYLYVR